MKHEKAMYEVNVVWFVRSKRRMRMRGSLREG